MYQYDFSSPEDTYSTISIKGSDFMGLFDIGKKFEIFGYFFELDKDLQTANWHEIGRFNELHTFYKPFYMNTNHIYNETWIYWI